MKKNLTIILTSIIFLALIIGLPFAFDNSQIQAKQEIFVFYIISKVVFSLILCFAVVWSVIAPRARGTVYILLVTASLLQGFPALCRAAPSMSSFGVAFEIIVLAIGLIAFIVIFSMLTWTSKKQLASDEKSAGKEIEIQEEKTVLNGENK